MKKEFIAHIQQVKLIQPSEKLLVAVSGGLDSVVLCHLLQSIGYNFSIAHCNFCLRGEESDGDEIFVRELSKRLQKEIHVQKFDTKNSVVEQRSSIQEVARQLRYTWFASLQEKFGYKKLLTAHHATDNTETMLINLVRGTGLAGLHGIPAQNDWIVRPLLPFSRQQLLEYAYAQQLQWREDSSNQSDYYTRNKIRHNVWPVLAEINPSIDQTMYQNAQRFLAAERILQYFVRETESKLLQNTENQIIIKVSDIQQLPEPHLVLYEILKKYGFNETHIQNLLQAQNGQAGKQILSATHRLSLEGEHWLLSDFTFTEENFVQIRANEKTKSIDSQYFIEIIYAKNEGVIPNLPRNEIRVDAALLQFPLQLRRWQQGDIFCPLGMNGRKQKVSDALTNAKLGYTAKQHAKVLCNADGKIIWLLGLRADERFKITQQTQEIIQIKQVQTTKNQQLR